MKIILNGKQVTIPSSLSEITIGQRIDFHNQHGQLLDQMLESILKMEDEIFRDLELLQWQNEKMYRTFAFFAGTTPEALKESKFIDEIATIYNSSLAVLLEDEQNLELQREFVWKGEQWVIAHPELKQGHTMTFGELIDAKQTIQDIVQLGRGKWEYMVRLCAIYLRKKGEPYSEEFLYEDSERLKLMHELPMNIAMQVGFFLSVSINSLTNILKSSGNPGLSQKVDTLVDTLSSMVGSTS